MSLLETNRDHAFARRTNNLRASTIREILKVTERPDIISFAGGLPAPELFPAEAIADAARDVLATFGHMPLQYSVTEGVPQLRELVATRLNAQHGCDLQADDILITGGSQQGLDLIAKIFLDPGDLVVLENPSYLGAIQAFQAYEPSFLTVATDAQGMIPEALEQTLRGAARKPKLLYLVPNFQNPTGVTLAGERRDAILAICERFGVPIVEDDPYGELRFEGDHLRPLMARPSGATVIYLGTGSKILAPGLRVAWMVIKDRAVREKIVPAKQAADLHTGTFAQYVFWEYARRPEVMARQLEVIRSVYRSRRDAMHAMLRSSFGDEMSFTVPAGGMFFWTALRSGTDTEALLPAAAEQHVVFVPGAAFFPNREVHNALRLNFSNSSEESIRTGIERLALAFRSFARRSPV